MASRRKQFFKMVRDANVRFSVIIPTFDTVGMLGQCLEALYEQVGDKEEFEIIVVNDGGKPIQLSDYRGDRHEPRIRLFAQDHKGPARARNLGIENAKGRIVLFLDDDSLPAPNWLKATIDAWDRWPDCDGIGGYVLSNPEDNMCCRVNADFFNWYLDQQSVDGLSSFLVTCNAGYKKDILNQLGQFDDRFKRASGEDRDLNIRILKQGGKLKLDKNILVYHDRDLSLFAFAKKNFNYGKAAYCIYAKYPAHKSVSSHGYYILYASILRRYGTLHEKAIAFLLLTLSQAATALGYVGALLSKKMRSQVSEGD